jgi:hypothetical protein
MAISRLEKFTINIFNPQKILFFLWLTLLIFPKGGIKISNIPITWGYLLVGILCVAALFRQTWKMHILRLQTLLCLFPFQIVSSMSMLYNGVETMGWVISFLISFFFLPFVFLFVLSQFIETMDFSYFLKLLKTGITLISYYGIFLFIYKQFTGNFIEIPFLTVNLGDVGELWTKCNSRGIVTKLISTYNNGQLFGVSVLMLLPLYSYVETNRWNKLITTIALILTLARTVWIGLFFHEILYSLIITRDRRQLIKKFLPIFFGSLAVLFFISNYYGFEKSFFFDPNLGGRREQLMDAIHNYTFFPSKPFSCILEMTYCSILSLFGMVGLFSYIFAMIVPLFFCLQFEMSKVRLCILLGLINYTVVAFSDGATQYIPILAFFWFLMSLLMRKNYEQPKNSRCMY